MLTPAMTAPRTRKPAATKPTPAKSTRTRSALVEAGDVAMRKLLLSELRRQSWNLTGTATALRMTGPSNVLHAIKRLGLSAEYDAAKAAGKVSPGNRTS